ncbi:hypothetical protein NXY28_21895 [Bacteroides thetaiotaomicron]|nr:hypothetical protein NXY28_21895 [Bacteroides thetaiotaomicron]
MMSAAGVFMKRQSREPIRGMNPDGATKETYYQRVIPSSSSFLTRVVDKRSVWSAHTTQRNEKTAFSRPESGLLI